MSKKILFIILVLSLFVVSGCSNKGDILLDELTCEELRNLNYKNEYAHTGEHSFWKPSKDTIVDNLDGGHSRIEDVFVRMMKLDCLKS